MPQGIPVKPLIPTDWTDPKRSSVFDPLYKRAVRQIASTLGLGEPETMLETAMPNPIGTVVAVGKRVAPRRAAKELANLLLGRSKRVPEGFAEESLKDFGEARLTRVGIGTGTTGSAPPPPTILQISEARNSGFRAPSRDISRAPGLTEKFRMWQRSLGRTPERRTNITINPNRSPELVYRPGTKRTSPGTTDRLMPKSSSTSLHDLSRRGALKLMSERELRNLLEGPQKAFKAGLIDRAKMVELLTANKQKVDDYFAQMRDLGAGNDNEALQNSLTSHVYSILAGKTK